MRRTCLYANNYIITNTCAIAGTSVVCSMMKLNGNTIGVRLCSVDGCTGTHVARGYCKKHWKRWKNHGNPDWIGRTTHGMNGTAEHTAWFGIKTRCYNKNYKYYDNYGGRGIKVCDRWLESFENFFEDMGRRPKGHTIERIDNDGNYEPSNCRWATNEEQSRNKSTSINIKIKGTKKNIAEWCRDNNIPYGTAYNRIRSGWEPVRAVTTAPRKLRSTSFPFIHDII